MPGGTVMCTQCRPERLFLKSVNFQHTTQIGVSVFAED